MNLEKPSEIISFPETAKEINALTELDQATRNENKSGVPASPEIDHANTARMKAIVSEIGWPTKSKVGEHAAFNAWLLVQHADDISLQEHCLALMKAAPAGEVDPINIAYLEDRVRVSNGQPQRYGTQYERNGNDTNLAPVDDMERVHERRIEIGLKPLQ